jgi:uncharacterized protein (TIGR02453 family)
MNVAQTMNGGTKLGASTRLDRVDPGQAFRGWDDELIRFFEGLERHNSKEWFDQHRADYQRAVREPTEALAAELAPAYGPGRIFRINRDARFAAGHPPYRTNAAIEFGGTGIHNYLSVSANELIASVGLFRTDSSWVTRFREAVAGPQGHELLAIVEELEKHGFLIDGDAVRTVPRGYPADHPQARLLRYRSIYASRRWPPAEWLGDRRPLDLVVSAWRRASPLVDWLRAHCPVGAA